MSQMPTDVPTTTVSEVADDAVVIDVREPDEWAAGHAPNAVHVPLGDLPDRVGDLPDTDGGSVPVVCRSGSRSARAVAWLTRQGFDVVNLDGGMRAWEASGKPLHGAEEPRII